MTNLANSILKELHPPLLKNLLRKEINELPDYDPGADPDTVAHISGITDVIKLSNNENPYGTSPLAYAAMAQLLDGNLGLYPDPFGIKLCHALAQQLGVDHTRIILGNGSENILELLCQTFVSEGDLVLTQQPCFGLHEIFPKMMGGRLTKIRLTPSFENDTTTWHEALDHHPAMVMISNPCNPTGTFFTIDQLIEMINYSSPQTIWVLDEAYYEYAINDPSYPNGLEILQSCHRPWIVLRTFSKAYGLAGLRIGYGVACNPDFIAALHRVRTPYNVNTVAQTAAYAALSDTNHVHNTVQATIAERHRITTVLHDAGFQIAPSVTNFIFIDTQHCALQVSQELQSRGVIIKPWREPGYDTFIRMSIGLPSHNDRCIDALLDVTLRMK